MRVYFALVRRELGSFFKSLSGYVVISSVLLLLGFSLMDLVEKLNARPTDVPVTELFYQTAYFWVAVLLTCPVITMRTFAAERATGTYEALMTTPVGDWQVVLAKFTATFIFYLLTWLPLAALLLALREISGESSLFEPRVVATTFLGIALVGALYMAIGCFASALTRSQVIAAMVAFLLGVGLWVLSLQSPVGIAGDGRLGAVWEHISLMRHVNDFSRGLVDSSYVAFYATGTWLFLFLTHRVVESRRWT
jgi:ABC-2 type transport system permease protein